MTESQVISILHVPSGDYASRPDDVGKINTIWWPDDVTVGKSWHSDTGFIVVFFDKDGKVKRPAHWVSKVTKK